MLLTFLVNIWVIPLRDKKGTTITNAFQINFRLIQTQTANFIIDKLNLGYKVVT